jgi:hypothetical protein
MPGGQWQFGIWLMTSQIAFTPHVPIQGFSHLFLIQALSLEQSEFNTHSGLQPWYGSPKYSGKHEQTPSSHFVFGPQSQTGSSAITGDGGGFGLHPTNGSPSYPSKQTQFGMWFKTLQFALKPQLPGHGSTHFSRIQARLLEHSEFIWHSGLQFGGDPR